MNNYKKLTPCIFIQQGKAVKWFNDDTILADDVVKLATVFKIIRIILLNLKLNNLFIIIFKILEPSKGYIGIKLNINIE